jgi:hypothetical protein
LITAFHFLDQIPPRASVRPPHNSYPVLQGTLQFLLLGGV